LHCRPETAKWSTFAVAGELRRFGPNRNPMSAGHEEADHGCWTGVRAAPALGERIRPG
jgi:hypothetical protein